jgi:hypothetical protein
MLTLMSMISAAYLYNLPLCKSIFVDLIRPSHNMDFGSYEHWHQNHVLHENLLNVYTPFLNNTHLSILLSVYTLVFENKTIEYTGLLITKCSVVLSV